jgi:A/G-specific adenine glycosylase
LRDAGVTHSEPLLDWYDANARVMPWRVSPEDRRAGIRPDPYRIWMSEVMLQQTTVAAVRAYFRRFTDRWPTVADLAGAEDAAVMGEWAGLGYYARARNLLKCARAVVADHGGVFPLDYAGLRQLPGIGPYTAAAIASIAYDEAATVVDGNVERVIARLFNVQTPLPAAKPELTAIAERLTPKHRPGDYAQAMMDLGATICTPRKPACGICPLRSRCQSLAEGDPASLPRKTPKPEKPIRSGTLWVAQRPDGALLLERRPEKGLLGGMLGFPGTDWDAKGGALTGAPPLVAEWQAMEGEVRHTFTHFHLRLQVFVAQTEAAPHRGAFFPSSDFSPGDLPTLMRKAYDVASPALMSR